MNKTQSQLVGFIFLFLLMNTYFNYFSPKSTKNTPSSPKVAVQIPKINQLKNLIPPPPTTTNHDILLENEDTCIKLTPQGGMVKSVKLKKYKNKDHAPLQLLDAQTSRMAMLLPTEKGIVPTQNFLFTAQQKNKHQVIFTYTLNAEKGQSITYTYTLPQKGTSLNSRAAGIK